jgi:hypothetical protein
VRRIRERADIGKVCNFSAAFASPVPCRPLVPISRAAPKPIIAFARELPQVRRKVRLAEMRTIR